VTRRAAGRLHSIVPVPSVCTSSWRPVAPYFPYVTPLEWAGGDAPPQPFGNQNAMQLELKFPKMELGKSLLNLFEAQNGNRFNKFD
jgi:hypothetical protein